MYNIISNFYKILATATVNHIPTSNSLICRHIKHGGTERYSASIIFCVYFQSFFVIWILKIDLW